MSAVPLEYRDAGRCANCGERIRETIGPDFRVFDHPDHGNHTVCDWRPDMEPTGRVATPMNGLEVLTPAITERTGGKRLGGMTGRTMSETSSQQAAPDEGAALPRFRASDQVPAKTLAELGAIAHDAVAKSGEGPYAEAIGRNLVDALWHRFCRGDAEAMAEQILPLLRGAR